LAFSKLNWHSWHPRQHDVTARYSRNKFQD
jgi:hypothetical protein